MSLIDSIETTIPGANNVSGRELLQGEQVYYRYTVRNPRTRDPIDLTTIDVDVVVRHLLADVSVSAGGGMRVTNYEEDEAGVAAWGVALANTPTLAVTPTIEEAEKGIGGFTIPKELQGRITDPYANTTGVPVKLLIVSFAQKATHRVRRRFRHLLIYRRAE